MVKTLRSLSLFQVVLVLFGAGGFVTGGGIVYSFGEKAQKIEYIEQELTKGVARDKCISDILIEHGETLARIDERTRRLLQK